MRLARDLRFASFRMDRGWAGYRKKWITKKKRRAEMDDYNKQSGQFSAGESTGTGGTGTAARMKEQAANKVADVKEKVSDLGRKAADKCDESREAAAEG